MCSDWKDKFSEADQSHSSEVPNIGGNRVKCPQDWVRNLCLRLLKHNCPIQWKLWHSMRPAISCHPMDANWFLVAFAKEHYFIVNWLIIATRMTEVLWHLGSRFLATGQIDCSGNGNSRTPCFEHCHSLLPIEVQRRDAKKMSGIIRCHFSLKRENTGIFYNHLQLSHTQLRCGKPCCSLKTGGFNYFCTISVDVLIVYWCSVLLVYGRSFFMSLILTKLKTQIYSAT